jgi:protein gp37
MGDRTNISWSDATWNPIRGCSRVSMGCVHCYAETIAARFSKPGQAYDGLTDKNGRWNGQIMVVEKHMLDPIRWREPRKIFVNSMSDLFHENIADEVIDRVYAVMAAARRHTFQILTKRPARMLEYMTSTANGAKREMHVQSSLAQLCRGRSALGQLLCAWPPRNVWLGVSTEDQKTADERIPLLLQTPAAVRWISAEPLLGPIELVPFLGERPGGLDWVVVGGESGPGHRPMEPWWLSAIATECFAWSVPLFVKQDSGSKPGKQGQLSDDLWAFKDFPKVAA